jgi:flagellar biosynthesis anti-sigma factor FlgM
MRIDDKLTPGSISTTALGATERTEADKRTGKAGAKGGSDSIQLSSDAQLLHGALKAAADLPVTRAERVDEVRRKLANGEIGQDAGRLADRLIDDLLGK